MKLGVKGEEVRDEQNKVLTCPDCGASGMVLIEGAWRCVMCGRYVHYRGAQ